MSLAAEAEVEPRVLGVVLAQMEQIQLALVKLLSAVGLEVVVKALLDIRRNPAALAAAVLGATLMRESPGQALQVKVILVVLAMA